MLPCLLVGAAFASDELDLPPAPDTRPAPPVQGSAMWIGVTPPVVGIPLHTSAPLALAVDIDLRWPSQSAWIQPELRVGVVRDFGLDDGVILPGTDTLFLATFGARFGTDKGFYGGLSGGLKTTWTQASGADTVGFDVAYHAYGGYAFRVSDRVRVSPELTVGTMNTLAVRVEWGG